MWRNNRGFTLIELLIAIFILMFGMMALLYTISVAMSANQQNVIRDEAVSVAAQQMSIIKSTPYTQLTTGENVIIGLSTGSPLSREFRNTAVGYTVTTKIRTVTTDTLSVQVLVTWSLRGRPYQHSVTSMVSRGV